MEQDIKKEKLNKLVDEGITAIKSLNALLSLSIKRLESAWNREIEEDKKYAVMAKRDRLKEEAKLKEEGLES